MPESQNTPEQAAEPRPETPAYTPASPTKRIVAWVGVIYMLIIVALSTYAIATGELLGGLTGLMVAPAFGGLAAITLMRWRDGQYRGHKAGALLIAILAGLACALNLFWAGLSLFMQFGG
jgi:uncharacterized membrane protein YhaH (DUF805 family)